MKLTVVLINTWETTCRLVHEGQSVPYSRRSVQIELTPEQVKALMPIRVGTDRGNPVFEQIGEHWLEQIPQDKKLT